MKRNRSKQGRRGRSVAGLVGAVMALVGGLAVAGAIEVDGGGERCLVSVSPQQSDGGDGAERCLVPEPEPIAVGQEYCLASVKGADGDAGELPDVRPAMDFRDASPGMVTVVGVGTTRLAMDGKRVRSCSIAVAVLPGAMAEAEACGCTYLPHADGSGFNCAVSTNQEGALCTCLPGDGYDLFDSASWPTTGCARAVDFSNLGGETL